MPGLIGGPLGCLGVAMLLAGQTPRVRVAGLALVGAACALLGAEIAPNDHSTAVAFAVLAAVLAGIPTGYALKRWPWALAFLVLPMVPARIAFTVDGTHTQLQLPLYVLAVGAGVQIVLETIGGDRRTRELGPMALPLAAFVLWNGVSLL